MKAEYVRLKGTEHMYGEKDLLSSQLELLNMIKGIKRYKLLRSKELLLKVEFKGMLGEVLEMLEKLERFMPKTHYQEIKHKEKQVSRTERERIGVEAEIRDIQRKIKQLQAEM